MQTAVSDAALPTMILQKLVIFTHFLHTISALSVKSFPFGSLRAIPKNKPLQIVFLGDSLTEGTGDDDGGGYPSRLMQQITQPSTWLNVGQSGWDLQAIIEGYNSEPSELERAKSFYTGDATKVAFGLFGSNDLWYLYEYANPTASDEQVAVDIYRQHLAKLSTSLLQMGVTRFVFGLLDDQSKRPCVANPGTEPTFSSISNDELSRMSRLVSAFNLQVTLTCSTLAVLGASCTTVDLYSTDIFTNPATIGSDGNHPNSNGYDVIARLFSAAIQPALQ